jgi:hypothetical protein
LLRAALCLWVRKDAWHKQKTTTKAIWSSRTSLHAQWQAQVNNLERGGAALGDMLSQNMQVCSWTEQPPVQPSGLGKKCLHSCVGDLKSTWCCTCPI